MSRISIVRTDAAWPGQSALDGAKAVLFGALDGASRDDQKSWRRFWKRVRDMEPGEVADVEIVVPRNGPFHRRHMKIEASVFNAQERFDNFDRFRDWLKIGAAWVDWVPGPKGGIVPLPKSVSYAKADEDEFRQFHDQAMAFLRGPHAAPYLWRHLANPHEMMDSVLKEFGE